jgi:hypothetical protein
MKRREKLLQTTDAITLEEDGDIEKVDSATCCAA